MATGGKSAAVAVFLVGHRSVKLLPYRIGWSQPDKVARRELDGYEIMYEIDEKERTRRSLILRDGLVLIGKKL